MRSFTSRGEINPAELYILRSTTFRVGMLDSTLCAKKYCILKVNFCCAVGGGVRTYLVYTVTVQCTHVSIVCTLW